MLGAVNSNNATRLNILGEKKKYSYPSRSRDQKSHHQSPIELVLQCLEEPLAVSLRTKNSCPTLGLSSFSSCDDKAFSPIMSDQNSNPPCTLSRNIKQNDLYLLQQTLCKYRIPNNETQYSKHLSKPLFVVPEEKAL